MRVSEPDLFVVCKSCSSEVSPYVTECPYCGQRVRKRAPKIEKEPAGEQPRRRQARSSSLPRLRRGEMPGVAPDTRPWATGVLIGLSLLATVLVAAGLPLVELGTIYASGQGEEWWRILAAPFIHVAPVQFGYAFIALLAVGVFGMHIERRYGAPAVVGIFLAAGAGGAALALAAASAGLGYYPVWGANGAALGLLCAWLVEDRRAYRRGDDRDNDLLGVYVFAAVLALLFLADPAANAVAAVGGALTGALAGLLLSARA